MPGNAWRFITWRFIPADAGNMAYPRGAIKIYRFIPADAGNMFNIGMDSGEVAAHPRGRGEHGASIVALVVDTGSSPRTRGTSPFPLWMEYRGRFIPADAGNICSAGSYGESCPVHPRGRGEHRS